MHQETCPTCCGVDNIQHTVTIFRTSSHGMKMYSHLRMTNPVAHGTTRVLGNPNGIHPKHTPLIHSRKIHTCICQRARVTVALTLTPAVTMAKKPGQLLRVPRPMSRLPSSTGPILVLRHAGGHSWASRPEKLGGLPAEPSTKVERVVNQNMENPKARSSILHLICPNSMNPSSWKFSLPLGQKVERKGQGVARVRAERAIQEARMDVR